VMGHRCCWSQVDTLRALNLISGTRLHSINVNPEITQ
jgi:hypothetical protein